MWGVCSRMSGAVELGAPEISPATPRGLCEGVVTAILATPGTVQRGFSRVARTKASVFAIPMVVTKATGPCATPLVSMRVI